MTTKHIKSHLTDWEKLEIEPATPGLEDIGLSPTHFCGFPGYKQFRWVGLRFVCWFHDGNTQRLTKSGFMEKPGIEPATPGLQGIALIHYTKADDIDCRAQHYGWSPAYMIPID